MHQALVAMARMNQPPTRLSQGRRGGTSSKGISLCTIHRFICVLFAIVILLLWLDHQIIVTSNNDGLKPKNYGGGPPPKEATRKRQGNGNEPVAVIAHAVSLIKCSKGSSVTGFLDAAAILRHSIHKNSIHYKPTNSTISSSTPRSRYSYKMYGIVHTSCQDHAKVLERLGYEIMVRDHPVKKEDIKGEWLRNHIEAENCCGSAEFIKLYGEI